MLRIRSVDIMSLLETGIDDCLDMRLRLQLAFSAFEDLDRETGDISASSKSWEPNLLVTFLFDDETSCGLFWVISLNS